MRRAFGLRGGLVSRRSHVGGLYECQKRALHRLSTLFATTLRQAPSEAVMASHQLLLRAAHIRQSSAGVYDMLPLGHRVMDNIEGIIDEEMHAIGGVKCSLPSLLPSALWRKSGRWEDAGPELFRLKDRKGTTYCLSPTHEESITSLVAADVSSHHQLPLRLYQVGRKFRDEARPRGGILRGREFTMKDLYSFDVDEAGAQAAYDEVRGAYERVMQRLQLPYVIAEADSGQIGGSRSQEVHVLHAVGEDQVWVCQRCGRAANDEVRSKLWKGCEQVDCEAADEAGEHQGLEVGHIFLLGTKYSEPMGAHVRNDSGAKVPLQMGCFGLGISRMMAALVELYHDEHGLQWPVSVAPFHATVVAGRSDSLGAAKSLCDALDPSLRAAGHAPSMVDDRPGKLSIGVRLKDARLLGTPYVVVLGRAWEQKQAYEVIHRGSNTSVECSSVNHVLDVLLAKA